MTDMQLIYLTCVLALSVMATRFIPFIVFRNIEKLPPIVDYLGKALPAAMMGLLVVYCFKDFDFSKASEIIPAVIASAAVAGLHLWKRNTILSIVGGTVIYMILIRVI